MFKVAQTGLNTQGPISQVKVKQEANKREKKRAGRCLLAATFFGFWRESLVSLRAVLQSFFELLFHSGFHMKM